ncbi:uncharacterized protein METZ01_LOCUS264170, partial [marine metagenome]
MEGPAKLGNGLGAKAPEPPLLPIISLVEYDEQ